MSWSTGFFVAKIALQIWKGGQKNGVKSSFEKELSVLLRLKATEEERERLEQSGVTVKNPTKMTLLAAALYEKAAKGDLSALKEIVSRVEPVRTENGGVVFIDDIRDKTQ